MESQKFIRTGKEIKQQTRQIQHILVGPNVVQSWTHTMKKENQKHLVHVNADTFSTARNTSTAATRELKVAHY